MSTHPTFPSTPKPPADERLPEIMRRLRQTYPDARCTLDYSTPFELLVATMLAAQCTDERVNRVTPALFAQFPAAAALADVDRDELEELIRPTGFYRQKARFLQGMAWMVAHQHGGEVPPDMDALLKMPGVARKTANVVLGVAFGMAEGIVVDTHVNRSSKRLGLTHRNNPNKVERELMELVPREDRIDFSHLMIFHGRRVCKARRPDCAGCVLNDLCPAAAS